MSRIDKLTNQAIEFIRNAEPLAMKMEEVWAVKNIDGVITLFLGKPYKGEDNEYNGNFLEFVEIIENNALFYKNLNLVINEPKLILLILEDKK